MKKGYYTVVYDENTNIYASKTCRTKLGRWFYVKCIERKVKKETGKCLKLGI